MPKLKLVVFDCDGVMFDSRYANREYYNHLLEKFGQPPMDRQAEDYVHSHNVMDAVDFIFSNNPQLIAEVHNYRQTVDYTPFLEYMVIEPDLKEFLGLAKRPMDMTCFRSFILLIMSKSLQVVYPKI